MSKNVDYYKNKLLLAKQKAAGKALMAEDEHWLDLTDEDEEEDVRVHLCFMAKGETSYDLEDEDRLSAAYKTDSEVCSDNLIEEQINQLSSKIKDFETRLKKEKNKVKTLEENLKTQHNLVLKFSLEKA